MKNILKIKNGEYPLVFIRQQDKDYRHGRRSTVTIVTDLEYAAVVALFTNPGEWSHTMQREDAPDIVNDYTEYDRLLSIKDNRDGVREVVMGKITAEEALAELVEALNA